MGDEEILYMEGTSVRSVGVVEQGVFIINNRKNEIIIYDTVKKEVVQEITK